MEASVARRDGERRARVVRGPERSEASHAFDPERGGLSGEGLDSALRSLSQLPRHRAERQRELYVELLRILQRDLSEHEQAARREAASSTRRSLETVRLLTRHLCDEFALELPAELSGS
jgi:hypothetical protein